MVMALRSMGASSNSPEISCTSMQHRQVLALHFMKFGFLDPSAARNLLNG